MYWVSAVSFISSESLMRAKATKANLVISSAMAAVALLLNLLLIQRLGIVGALAAGIATAVLGFIVQLYVARQRVVLPFPRRSYLFAFAILAGTAILAYWSEQRSTMVISFLAGAVLLARPVQQSIRFFLAHG
jgi:O-antigen/teichoic acid export membrane protein